MANPAFVSRTLTLQNYKPEIANSINAVIRYRIERLGPQFAQFARNSEGEHARDVSRQSLGHVILQVTRFSREGKPVWW